MSAIVIFLGLLIIWFTLLTIRLVSSVTAPPHYLCTKTEGEVAMSGMKMRVTWEVLRSGQPRPYADTEYEVKVKLETQGIEGYHDPDAPFKPITDMRVAENWLKNLPLTGYVSKEESDKAAWWETKLVSFTAEAEPGVYRFTTRAAFTD